MNEAYLKRGLGDALRRAMPGAFVLRHEDKFRAGVPDTSVTWRQRTAWVEVKYDRPSAPARVTPLQERTLRRLDGLLVMYEENIYGNRGVQVFDPVGHTLANWIGFDHQAVAELVRGRLEPAP